MVMKAWLSDTPLTVTCIVCHSEVHIEDTTVGELYANGLQAFACANHLSRSERLTWFNAWAKFATEQVTSQELATFEAQYLN